MTDLVEKVARAIYDEAKKDACGGAYVGEYGFPRSENGAETTLDGVFDLRDFAKAAVSVVLGEIEEPTRAMHNAAFDALRADPDMSPKEANEAVWQAMLKEFASQNNITIGGE